VAVAANTRSAWEGSFLQVCVSTIGLQRNNEIQAGTSDVCIGIISRRGSIPISISVYYYGDRRLQISSHKNDTFRRIASQNMRRSKKSVLDMNRVRQERRARVSLSKMSGSFNGDLPK
jgi:hypothetical protein